MDVGYDGGKAAQGLGSGCSLSSLRKDHSPLYSRP